MKNQPLTSRRSTSRERMRWLGLSAVLALCSAGASAQMLNYSEQLGAYKDMSQSGVKVTESVFQSVSARSRVNYAIASNKVVDQSALVQPDGTLKLPDNQQNIVIRTSYSDVQRAADGTLRIASPTIQGNVNGTVTLFVEGKGVENITVLNTPR